MNYPQSNISASEQTDGVSLDVVSNRALTVHQSIARSWVLNNRLENMLARTRGQETGQMAEAPARPSNTTLQELLNEGSKELDEAHESMHGLLNEIEAILF